MTADRFCDALERVEDGSSWCTLALGIVYRGRLHNNVFVTFLKLIRRFHLPRSTLTKGNYARARLLPFQGTHFRIPVTFAARFRYSRMTQLTTEYSSWMREILHPTTCGDPFIDSPDFNEPFLLLFSFPTTPAHPVQVLRVSTSLSPCPKQAGQSLFLNYTRKNAIPLNLDEVNGKILPQFSHPLRAANRKTSVSYNFIDPKER